MTTLPEEAVKAAATALANYIGHGMTEKCVDKAKVALTAAAPHLAAVRVKKLEWSGYNDEQGNPDRWDAEASSFGVFYSIEIQHDGYRVVFDHEAVGAIGVFDTLDAAKAAAQADYEARILSALEPSAARELALEKAARNAAMYLATGFITCPRCGEDVETKNTDAEYTLRAALSSPEPSDHRETVLYEAARKAQKAIAAILASGGLESDKWWDDLVSAQQSLATAIRALSSPDHPDAGKVEGDGWLPMTHPSLPKKGRFLAVATGEIERIAWNDPAAVVTVKAFDGPFVCYVHEDGAGFTDEFGEVYRADGVVIDAEDLTAADNVLRLTRWRPLPSAPASEGASNV